MAAVAKKSPTTILEGAINAWMAVHQKLSGYEKALQPKIDAAKDKVIGLMNAAGLKEYASKYGKVSLQTKKTTDWEGLARSLLTKEVIDSNVEKFTKVSDEFVRAPQSWGGKQ
jgi:hypothetical protein